MADQGTPFLQFERVAKSYGDIIAVDGVNLTVGTGEFVALVGASGSGKSTLLKMVNRLVEPSAGRVLIEGAVVTASPAAQLRHRIGYVFQGIGLFAHMTLAENIGIVPRLQGYKLPAARVAELLELVDLDPDMAGRYPDELSGGQRQRIGVARALADNPPLLLMDEPFGALDPITRDALGERVRELHQSLGLTTVMVTHDMAEALLLADRVLVMDGGQIVADETPAALLAGEGGPNGAGGSVAQSLVAVPRDQARRLARIIDEPAE